ncbi:MAG: nuoE [Francisellaceae bacterium]|nr:nuoE [Francisellaceae bacterium]
MLSIETKEKIENWAKKFPPEQRQSAIIYALKLVQAENGGYLNETLIKAVADFLKMSHISALEVASFYTLFELEPIGRHKISVCTNISCMLNGSEQVITYLQNKLNIKVNETTKDGRFTLKAVECLAACDKAPLLEVHEHYHGPLTLKKIDIILEELD